jgi:hypothetical protein
MGMPQGEPPGPPMPDAPLESSELTRGGFWGDPKAADYGLVWAGDGTQLRQRQEDARRESSRGRTATRLGPGHQNIMTTDSLKPGAAVVRCSTCDVGNSPITVPQGNGTVKCGACAGIGDLYDLVDDPRNPPILGPRKIKPTPGLRHDTDPQPDRVGLPRMGTRDDL